MKPNRHKVLNPGPDTEHVPARLELPRTGCQMLSGWHVAFSQQLCEAGAIIPILHMQKLRHREVKSPAQGNAAKG